MQIGICFKNNLYTRYGTCLRCSGSKEGLRIYITTCPLIWVIVKKVPKKLTRSLCRKFWDHLSVTLYWHPEFWSKQANVSKEMSNVTDRKTTNTKFQLIQVTSCHQQLYGVCLSYQTNSSSRSSGSRSSSRSDPESRVGKLSKAVPASGNR